MEQVGKVIAVQGKMAEVQIRRTTACGGDCGKCGGCFPTKIVVQAKNLVEAEEGQMVKLDSSTKNILSAAFILYIVPTILLIASYLFTQHILMISHYSINAEMIGIVVSITVLALFFVFIRAFDIKLSHSKKLELKIVRIIE